MIARDEERHIGAALQSLATLADELVVLLDERTRDRTAAICAEYGARVIPVAFHSFPAQRNLALQLCQAPWVLFLDADERLTADLHSELAALKTQLTAGQAPAVAGYWIPRHNLYWGYALRGGGWYPDHQLRLLCRARARYDETRLVHEVVKLDGAAGYLQGHLRHINIESWDELRRKQRRYALAEAASLHGAGVRFKPQNIVLQPLREIWRRFVTWNGYRDGWRGILLALVMGWYELIKYARLRRLGRAAASTTSEDSHP